MEHTGCDFAVWNGKPAQSIEEVGLLPNLLGSHVGHKDLAVLFEARMKCQPVQAAFALLMDTIRQIEKQPDRRIRQG